ncbi:MAG: M14 family zinc carboxypeptidase [Bacteroidota bacterium]
MNTFFRSFLLTVITASVLSAQELPQPDPCGFPDINSMEFKLAASGNWGYGYDTLKYDLSQWKLSPFAVVESVGVSVQNRTLFVITIQDTSADPLNKRVRVWMHARTHPGEVQGTWVVNEMIKMLLGNTEFAMTMRQRYVFNIMPMYNPDGVELGNARENANMIDIESNWNAASPQKEVLVLRSQFQKYMAKPNPMKMMLNIHSDNDCLRFFVYHAPGGTTPAYAALERRFIAYVQSGFPNAIQPYTYFVSWTSAPSLSYPESWCWANYKEKIMALTYEDANCASASKFDSTGNAILRGIDLYLQDTTAVTSVSFATNGPVQYLLGQNYPNPFNPTTTIAYELPNSGVVSLKVYDVMGREAAVLAEGEQSAGRHTAQFSGTSLSSGIYFYQLRFGGRIETKSMQLIK